MPQVPGEVRRERAARLREAGEAAAARFLAGRVGTHASVLVERPELGRSEHYAPVRLDRAATPGAVVAATITGAEPGALIGRIAA